jgi:8-oxo-dGTP pyrophosphatase MutT (NUDIX family)
MSPNQHIEIRRFLAQRQPFGGWRDEWVGVLLECNAYLADDLPAPACIGSVRALVLRDHDVLLVHSSPPMLIIGGRCENGEAVEETLLREVAEESGWVVKPIAVIGFIHVRHIDDQRPDWGRPAPDFIDPLFAVEAVKYDPAMVGPNENPCEFVPISSVEQRGIERINQTFLREALRKRS